VSAVADTVHHRRFSFPTFTCRGRGPPTLANHRALPSFCGCRHRQRLHSAAVCPTDTQAASQHSQSPCNSEYKNAATGVLGAMPPATPRAVWLSPSPPHPCDHSASATLAESRLVVGRRQWRRHARAARRRPRLRRRVAHGTHQRWCVGGGEREQGHRDNGERHRH